MLVSHDPDERAVLSLVLQRAGLAVTMASDQERAMKSWLERPADLVALASVGNPLENVSRVRAETEVPLVIFIDPITEALHRDLLVSGTDLVIVRPFSGRLLIAQVQALVRRAGSVPLFSLPALSQADLTLDAANRTVQIAGQILPTEVIVERGRWLVDTAPNARKGLP